MRPSYTGAGASVALCASFTCAVTGIAAYRDTARIVAEMTIVGWHLEACFDDVCMRVCGGRAERSLSMNPMLGR
jgi:hypothetical protein